MLTLGNGQSAWRTSVECDLGHFVFGGEEWNAGDAINQRSRAGRRPRLIPSDCDVVTLGCDDPPSHWLARQRAPETTATGYLQLSSSGGATPLHLRQTRNMEPANLCLNRLYLVKSMPLKSRSRCVADSKEGAELCGSAGRSPWVKPNYSGYTAAAQRRTESRVQSRRRSDGPTSLDGHTYLHPGSRSRPSRRKPRQRRPSKCHFCPAQGQGPGHVSRPSAGQGPSPPPPRPQHNAESPSSAPALPASTRPIAP